MRNSTVAASSFQYLKKSAPALHKRVNVGRNDTGHEEGKEWESERVAARCEGSTLGGLGSIFDAKRLEGGVHEVRRRLLQSPDMVSSFSEVFEMVPADHVFGSSVETDATQAVN